MQIRETELEGVLIVKPDVFEDQRGFFMETYQRQRYADAGMQIDFVQDNLSFSRKGTLRGLHFQHPRSQAKLVQVIRGEIFDVVVDIRRKSPTFRRWIGECLSDKNKLQLFVPQGFAHGFYVFSETAIVHYKCSDTYAPECEGGLLWSDPELAVDWPSTSAIVSQKDARLPCLKDIAWERLPQ